MRKSIRLLKVEPGDTTLGISLSLFATTIATAYDCYHALSYTWGDPGAEVAISINQQTFLVRRNLYHFLQQLHNMCWTGYLWVDAICIDQSSLSERNQQVQMMHQIYSAAQKVFVWLGLGSIRLDCFFDKNQDGLGFDHDGFVDGRKLDDEDLLALLELVRRPSWNRIWVAQEMASAKEIVLMCGGKSIRLGQMKRLVGKEDKAYDLFHDEMALDALLFNKPGPFRTWERSDLGTWRFIVYFFWHHLPTSEQQPHRNLSNLVATFGHMDCQDKHDCVYALLGLVALPNERREPHFPRVDYEQSLAQLFMNTLSHCVRHKGELAELSLAVDLAAFMNLDKHCTDQEKKWTISVQHYLLGIVHTEYIETESTEQGAQALIPANMLEDEIWEWAQNGKLVVCGLSETECAVFYTRDNQPGDKLFAIDVDLASTDYKFRPAGCDGLMLRVGSDNHGAWRVSVGIRSCHGVGFDLDVFRIDGDHDAQLLLLAQWRRIFEEHLQKTQLEISSDGHILTITMTLGDCIRLSQDLLEAADEWKDF